jgi:hypothetical protein
MSDGASHCAGAQPQRAFSPEESSTQKLENSARGGRWPCAKALLFGGLSLFIGDVSATQPTISPTVGQIKVKMAITRAHQLHRSAQPALQLNFLNTGPASALCPDHRTSSPALMHLWMQIGRWQGNRCAGYGPGRAQQVKLQYPRTVASVLYQHRERWWVSGIAPWSCTIELTPAYTCRGSEISGSMTMLAACMVTFLVAAIAFAALRVQRYRASKAAKEEAFASAV